MTELASCSSIRKLKLMFEAPCETIRMLISERLPKALRAIPGVYFRLFPTRQMRALLELTSTSPNRRKSLTITSRDDTLSRVSDTETSDVATISTDV